MEAKCPQCKKRFTFKGRSSRTMIVGWRQVNFCSWDCKKAYREERDEKVRNVVDNILKETNR